MVNRPEHANNFMGGAKAIPERDTFLLPYQEKWVRDPSIMCLMEKSRRIGISYGSAYKVVRKHSLADHALDTWVSSRDEATARLFINDCKLFTRRMKLATDDLGVNLIEKESVYSIKFSNDTDINSVASNPDVFAGKGGSVVLDEMALRKDPEGVYSIASPTIDWGGEMDMISTHRGTANFFNKLVKEIVEKGNPKGISHHKVTLQNALEQGFLWKLQTKLQTMKKFNDPRLQMTEEDYWNYQKKRASNRERFDQEYCCIPADEASTFIGYDLIAMCQLTGKDAMTVTTEETVDYAHRKGSIRYLRSYDNKEIAELPCPIYLGLDVARSKDLSVIWVAGKILGLLFPLVIIEMDKVEFDRQEKELYAIMSMPNFRRGGIDQTGIGRQMGERAQKKFGQLRVDLVTFTSRTKEELAFPLRKVLEDRTMRLPEDEQVEDDFRSIKKESGVGDNIRFSSDHGDNGHSDRFWAAALMVAASTDANSGPTWCASCPSGEGSIVGANFNGMIPVDLNRF